MMLEWVAMSRPTASTASGVSATPIHRTADRRGSLKKSEPTSATASTNSGRNKNAVQAPKWTGHVQGAVQNMFRPARIALERAKGERPPLANEGDAKDSGRKQGTSETAGPVLLRAIGAA